MSFVLGDIEQQALRSMKDLHQVNEYGLKGLNIIRIEADGVTNPTDAQLTFTIDSSKLAGNIMLNRIQMEIDYEVKATGQWTSAPWVADTGFNSSLALNANNLGYLMSPSNGAMDSLCGNKSFSSIELSNKQVQLVQDSRTPEKIEILSRLLDPKSMNEAGIYMDNAYGGIDNKAGAYYELVPITDYLTQPMAFVRGTTPCDIKEHNLFYKRNMNKQYINKIKTDFADNNGNTVAPATAPYPWSNFFDGGEQVYDWAVASNVAGSTQTNVFKVKEDFLHDIFVSQYQKNPVYMGFPTTDLVFTFTKSNVLNSLYKTSNGLITAIDVKIKSMRLNVLTYNYGLIDFPIKDYYIPFYSELSHSQVIPLSTDNKDLNKDKTMMTRQYNSVPQYFIIYCQEPTSSAGIAQNKQNALKPAKVLDLKLQIDNETNGPLYNMNIDELKHKTLTNLADDCETVEALFRRVNLPQFGVLGASGALSAYTALAANAKTYQVANGLSVANGVSSGRSYLDGLFVLKLGKDIRLPSDMCVGQDRKVSFTFTVSFDVVSNNATPVFQNASSVQWNQIAYFPSMYKFSPSQGLLKAEKFIVSDDEFKNLVNSTNSKVRSDNRSNNVLFTSQRPLMVGSGFGNLFEWAKSKVPMAKNIANAVSAVSSLIDHPVARQISSVSKAISGGRKKRGSSKKTIGRPKKMFRHDSR